MRMAMNNPCIDLSSNRSASLVTPGKYCVPAGSRFPTSVWYPKKLLSRTAIRTGRPNLQFLKSLSFRNFSIASRLVMAGTVTAGSAAGLASAGAVVAGEGDTGSAAGRTAGAGDGSGSLGGVGSLAGAGGLSGAGWGAGAD